MTSMKEKQAAFRLERGSERDVTGSKGPNPEILEPNAILSRVFQGYLDYLLTLSAGGKKKNKDWNVMKDKLTDAGHWKKSYKKRRV